MSRGEKDRQWKKAKALHDDARYFGGEIKPSLRIKVSRYGFALYSCNTGPKRETQRQSRAKVTMPKFNLPEE